MTAPTQHNPAKAATDDGSGTMPTIPPDPATWNEMFSPGNKFDAPLLNALTLFQHKGKPKTR